MKDLLSSVHFDRTPLRRISLPDIDTHIHYLHMDSLSSFNVYYFKLYYKDKAPVPFIITNDMHTDFKLPVHHLFNILFKYKTTPSSIRSLLMVFIENGGRHSVLGFFVCCMMLRNYYTLKDLISDDDADTVYDMITKKQFYTWYVNGNEVPAEYVTHLRIEYLPKDIIIRAVPIPYDVPTPYGMPRTNTIGDYYYA